MTKEEIVSKVKSLNLPENSYIVFGSGPLAVVGIREVNDVDLLVSKSAHQELKVRGWKELIKGPNDKPLTDDIFEAHDSWNFSSYNPTLDQLLQNAVIVDGVPFASIEDVRKWKSACMRPKDIVDIELIDSYYKVQS